MTKDQPPKRRKPLLSDDDRALWESVAKSATPLKKPRKTSATQASDESRPAIPVAKISKPIKSVALPLKAAAAKSKPPPLAPLTRRVKSKLAKGAVALDGRIDLHGLTQDEAHHALKRFLKNASADGASVVLVITGKGRIASEGRERGVLRRRVPEWLGSAEFRSFVIGFEEAHIGHGGEGALYVRVRKQRG